MFIDDLGKMRDSVKISENVYWDYRHNSNFLITGNSGTGKTFLLVSVLGQLLTTTKFITLLDPKKSILGSMSNADSLKGKVFVDVSEINIAIHDFYNEMIERFQRIGKLNLEGKRFNYTDYNFAPKFLIFDEFSLWCILNDKNGLGTSERRDYELALSDLNEIAIMGRELGFYLIIGTQTVSSSPLILRNQFNYRIIMGLPTKRVQKMMFVDSKKDLNSLLPMSVGTVGFVQLDNYQIGSFNSLEISIKFDFYKWIEYMSSLREKE